MNHCLRTIALASGLALAGGLGFSTQSAQAQGPYGRNGYQDFPFNQGSLFYQPLKPKPVKRPKVTQPARVQPGGYYVQQGNRYYYQGAPYAAAPVQRRRFFLFGR
jgi:hypothetical protein